MAENETSSTNQVTNFLKNNQSQLATVLIGILLVVAGALTYSYFQTGSNKENKNEGFGEITTPTPLLTVPGATNQNQEQGQENKGNYVVQTGDNLWKIALNQLGSGFRWREIAQLNNISQTNPVVKVGQTLKLPEGGQVASGTTTTASGAGTVSQPATPEKLPATYTVVRGDNLWNIANRFYGDGNKWRLIFDYDSNRLSMWQTTDGRQIPLIHGGNVLTIPTISQT